MHAASRAITQFSEAVDSIEVTIRFSPIPASPSFSPSAIDAIGKIASAG